MSLLVASKPEQYAASSVLFSAISTRHVDARSTFMMKGYFLNVLRNEQFGRKPLLMSRHSFDSICHHRLDTNMENERFSVTRFGGRDSHSPLADQ